MSGIKCPHCGKVFNLDTEDYNHHVSYWGEQEPVEHECPHCEGVMYLEERVHRYWSAGRTPQEARDA